MTTNSARSIDGAETMSQPSAVRRLKVVKLAELRVDTNKAFKLEGRSVLLCRTAEGVFALENKCTHQLASLEGGRMRAGQLFCPKHGARFDLRTGAVVGPLAKAPLATFPVSVDDEDTICIDWPVC